MSPSALRVVHREFNVTEEEKQIDDRLNQGLYDGIQKQMTESDMVNVE